MGIVASRTIAGMSESSSAPPAPHPSPGADLHVIVAGAHVAASATLPRLPALRRLMGLMSLSSQVFADDKGLATPLELTRARALGLTAPPGHIPWAAVESRQPDSPCAWITLCHWQVAADHALLHDPAHLDIDDATSRALHAAAAPYFLEDGIELVYHRADAWLAKGELFRNLPTRSLGKVVHQLITPDIFEAATPAGVVLRRLQNEMQMLFYTHPVNDERQSRGLRPINSYWVHGAGVWSGVDLSATRLQMETGLKQVAKGQAGAGTQEPGAAWSTLDQEVIAPLVPRIQAGERIDLSFCGERQAITYRGARPGMLSRVQQALGWQPALPAFDQL